MNSIINWISTQKVICKQDKHLIYIIKQHLKIPLGTIEIHSATARHKNDTELSKSFKYAGFSILGDGGEESPASSQKFTYPPPQPEKFSCH